VYAVASIHFFAGGFIPHMEGDEAEARSPKGHERGMGFLRRGSEPPPHQLWVWSASKLPQRGPEQSAGKFEIWCNVRPQKPYNVQVVQGTAERLNYCEGAKRYSRPSILLLGGRFFGCLTKSPCDKPPSTMLNFGWYLTVPRET